MTPFWILLCTFLTLGNGAKILGVFSVPSHSHFTMGFRLVKELADRGHQVAFINAFPQKRPIENLEDISVADIAPRVGAILSDVCNMGKLSYIGQLNWVLNLGLVYTENVLKHENVQQLLNSDRKFDVVISEHFMNEAMMVFAHRFNCPLILVAPGPVTVFNGYLFANPAPPSYVPSLLADYGPKMNFWRRLRNTFYDLAGELFVNFVVLPKQNELLKRTVPGAPDLSQVLSNVSLMLLASHVSVGSPVPHQPNVKEIGGYHVGPTKPLPQDIQEFLDGAKDGAILFSMGSVLKSADFSPDKMEAVLEAFSKIKQKVLWKFEADLPEKARNVKIVRWLPQQDVLAHPNVVAFITHAGLLGVIEAVYHGVPLLGLPVYWDQEKNVEGAIHNNFAVKVPFHQLNAENFERALTEIISNPKYRESVKMRSKLMHDRPMTPLDEAVYWIEYVVRHGGAPHLRSAALDLKWYQKYLVDVVCFIGMVFFALLFVTYLTYKCLVKNSTRSSIQTKKNK